MKNFNQLPGALLMLCWAAVVKSDNTALSPIFANSTIASQTSSSSTSTTSGSALITPVASSSSSLDSAAPTFTGTDPDDLVDWCITQYESYVNASGTPTVISTASNTGYYYEGPQSDVTLSSSEYSTTVTITSTIIPPGYTSPPQCVTGCVIAGNYVELEYWPTPRAAPNATTSSPSMITPPPAPLSAIVDGMTLYSPSNYLIFTNISAEYCALDLSPCTTIGSVVSITTLSFGESELSTEDCMHETSVLNYMDFNSPIPWSIVTNQYGCTILTETHPGSYLDSSYTLKPSIVFPTEVKTAINPDWAQCTFILGLFDPPSALSPVQQLTAGPGPGTTTAIQPSATIVLTPTVPAPQPESSVSSTLPQPTTISTLVPVVPTSTALPDPPASSIAPEPPSSTAIPDPATTTILAIPPASSIAPPADPGTSTTAQPVDPVTSSTEATVPGKSNFAPGTSISSTALASIIASVGGFGNDPPPASTITLPGPSSQAVVPSPSQAGGQPVSISSAVVTTLPSQVVSIAPGVSSTIPGQVVTIQPGSASAGSSALITTLPSQVISVAPGISSTIPGQVITVSPGAATTIPKIIISVGGSLSTIPAVTISASSQIFASPQPSSLATLPQVTATIGGQTITIAPDGQSATVSSQTVIAGGQAITVSGTTVSIGSSSIVVGSTTVAIITPPSTATSTKGSVAGYGSGGGANATSTLAVQASGGNRIPRGSVLVLGILVGLVYGWV